MKKNKNMHKKTRVHYAWAVYGKDEIRAVENHLRSGNPLAGGEATRKFEDAIAALFGKAYGVMVNSGSSANLVAVELMALPPSSEVITPILTFGTTLAPLIQKGLKPVFADVEEGTYLVNIDHAERLITKKTRALMIPSLMGNIPDMERLRRIAKKHNLIFVEDSCDTVGATFKGKPTGAYSDISTTSFYASHIITSGGCGGMVMINRPEWRDRARMLRGWGRTSSVFSESEDIDKRFRARIDGMVYDAKFIFKEVGYNFIPPEVSAVFGLQQLKKLKRFSRTRKSNFKALFDFFLQYQNFFILPRQDSRVETNWLAFPLTIRKFSPFKRIELVKYLEENGIQTRPVFTGDALTQPAFLGLRRHPAASYPITDAVMENAFVIGAHHGMDQAQIDYVEEIFKKFLRRY